MLRRINGGLAGGVIGTLAGGLAVWLLWKTGAAAWLDIHVPTRASSMQLYQTLVWGGLCGLLFLLPFWENRPVLRGIFLSLVPATLLLFVVLPAMGKGAFGLELGVLAPLLIAVLSFVWGIAASLWYAIST
jgi:hypothetical protein